MSQHTVDVEAAVITINERTPKPANSQPEKPFNEASTLPRSRMVWAGGTRIIWCSTPTRRFPAPYTDLAVDGKATEGWFVDLYLKRSRIPGARDTLPITLIANNTRIVAIDGNAPSSQWAPT